MRIRYPPKLIYHSQFDKHNCIDFHRVHCNVRIHYPPKLIYHSQFDKHNCIDFHRVHCNEPTPLLLGNF